MNSRERDARWIAEATALEAAGEAIVMAQHRAEMEAFLVKCANGNGPDRVNTAGPWRLRLREVARGAKLDAAVQHFNAADRLYWRIVLAWSSMLQQYARRDEHFQGMPAGELTGLYWYIGYMVAIRLNPEQASFGTYFATWRRSIGPRSPEMGRLVHDSNRWRGRKSEIRVESLDQPASDDSGERRVNLVPAEDGDVIERICAKQVWQVLDPALSDKQRSILNDLRTCDDMAEIGRLRGMSRERVRQHKEAILSAARERLGLQ